MKKPKRTMMDVANYEDYIDAMDDLEMERELELYDRGERIKMFLTSVIMVLAIAVVIVATYKLVEG